MNLHPAGPGHQQFFQEAQALSDRYRTNGIAPIEQIALLGQLIGRLISDLDPAHYETQPVLNALLENVVSGNDARGRPHA